MVWGWASTSRNSLVAMMGGTLTVASTPGEGATFAVWLPAVLGAHQRAA